MKFHEKLRMLRKEKGLSQEELAEILNVSRQAISKWESAQSYPETEKLIALSNLFGVTLDSLMKDKEIQHDQENQLSEPYWFHRGRYYEYKSKRKLFGLPLVHVNLGRGAKRAKGIVAIGNIATGFISIGLWARGLLSLGILSTGLFSLGAFSLGLLFSAGSIAFGFIAVGAIAVGIISIGALSIGMFSIGAASIASHVAIGDYARGHVAVGRIAHGVKTIVDHSPNSNFSMITADEVREAITSEFPNLWRWIVDLMTFCFRHYR